MLNSLAAIVTAAMLALVGCAHPLAPMSTPDGGITTAAQPATAGPTPTPTPGEGFVAISAGGQHSCAVRSDGGVECWGDDEYDQASPPEGEFIAVSAGAWHSCAVRRVINHLALLRAADAGETVAPGSEYAGRGIECWGNDEHGQGSPPRGGFATVSAGWHHSCAGGVCWGSNGFYGEASPPRGVSEVSAGFEHSCGIDAAFPGSGHVACWGSNLGGAASPPDGRFVAVSAGGRHTCGVRIEGRVECWGDNNYGQASPP